VNVKKWLAPEDNQKLIADVEQQLEADREVAVNSPMPEPESAAGGVYCEDGCHQIRPKYAMPKVRAGTSAAAKSSEAAVHLK
jgi:TPP-dependent pyruvate/acetoin dehydrogenase alpha subunit